MKDLISSIQLKVDLVFELNKRDNLVICQKVARGKLAKIKKRSESKKVVGALTHFAARSYTQISHIYASLIMVLHC